MPWYFDTHMRVLSGSYPMNTNIDVEKRIRIHNTSKNTLWVNPSMHNPYAAGG